MKVLNSLQLVVDGDVLSLEPAIEVRSHEAVHTPEGKLAFRVLCDAIIQWRHSPYVTVRIREHDWLFDGGRGSYSCEWICETLGLDVHKLRRLLVSRYDEITYGHLLHLNCIQEDRIGAARGNRPIKRKVRRIR